MKPTTIDSPRPADVQVDNRIAAAAAAAAAARLLLALSWLVTQQHTS